TLVNPMHWDDEPFDAIVSNPPYSIRWAGKSNPILINDERFSPVGILAPESKADLAFTMHMLSWLSPKGTAAIVQFPGVLYRSGAEQKIRKYMVDNNFIDSVIQLPSDLFFGTGISTCILVLKKSKGDNNILFIDASNEFVRNTNKNKLSDENINNILKLLEYRKNVDYKSVLISNEEISNNDYNISVNSYLKSESKEEKIDIKELNKRIEDVVKSESKIRIELDAIIKELEGDSYE
ncbi:MAG: type I restriction-modification system subunit M, partial [Bacilli bacterium]|nr:type I restriction-modification system subunit M [Bacilli bacterium]